MKIAIIGTSEITNKHIDALKNYKKNIFSISSTRKNSKNLLKFKKKYKIKKIYKNWKEGIQNAKRVKNLAFFITSRVEDNKKILEECCKTNKKIFIEKPIFDKPEDFKYFTKYKKQIFVGYNRIFYSGIKYLKKNLKLNNIANVIVKCPEKNYKQIIRNSCHIISVLFFLFGSLTIVKKIKRKKFINFTLRNKNNIQINLFFNISNSSNFSVEINENTKRYSISPIENLRIFNGFKILKNKVGNIYLPKKIKEFNEYKENKYKPGFEIQFKEFIKFFKGKKIYNDIIFAKRIVDLSNKLVS